MLRGGLDCRGLTALHVVVARRFPPDAVAELLAAWPEAARELTRNDCDQPPKGECVGRPHHPIRRLARCSFSVRARQRLGCFSLMQLTADSTGRPLAQVGRQRWRQLRAAQRPPVPLAPLLAAASPRLPSAGLMERRWPRQLRLPVCDAGVHADGGDAAGCAPGSSGEETTSPPLRFVVRERERERERESAPRRAARARTQREVQRDRELLALPLPRPSNFCLSVSLSFSCSLRR